MRALFSIVSLLVVLAIVGLIAARQMKTAVPVLPAPTPAATSDAVTTEAAQPQPPPGNVREQSQQLQQRVQSDVAKALEQGAAARNDEAGK